MEFVENILNQAKDTTKITDGLDEITNIFTLPIQYNDSTRKLNTNIIDDLELVKTVDEDKKEMPIYNHVFKSSNILGKTMLESVPKYYTTDVAYLKDSQQLIKQFKNDEINTISNNHNFSNTNIEETVTLWKEIKGETGFHSKYL